MMEHHRVSPWLLRCLVAFLFLALLFPALLPRPSEAVELRGDVLVDSAIAIAVLGGHGGQRYQVTITTLNGSTTVTTIKDGKEVTGTMSAANCLALWQYLLGKGIESMTDVSPLVVPPGQAQYTLTFRVGATTHSFSAAAVDFLPDSRYRDVVTAILQVPDHHVERGG